VTLLPVHLGDANFSQFGADGFLPLPSPSPALGALTALAISAKSTPTPRSVPHPDLAAAKVLGALVRLFQMYHLARLTGGLLRLIEPGDPLLHVGAGLEQVRELLLTILTPPVKLTPKHCNQCATGFDKVAAVGKHFCRHKKATQIDWMLTVMG
jgi:hypothetical protein